VSELKIFSPSVPDDAKCVLNPSAANKLDEKINEGIIRINLSIDLAIKIL
jgi:hypothetical protein